MRFYHLELTPSVIQREGVSFIALLTCELPEGAQVFKHMNVSGAWTASEHLLATLVDQLNALMWGLSDKKTRGRKPVPLQRPGMNVQQVDQPKRRTVENREVMAFTVEDFESIRTFNKESNLWQEHD